MLSFLYASILTAIGTVCPLLKKLCITSHRPFADILDARGEKILSEVLLHMHSLESLVYPMPDQPTIIHVSRLPLVELSPELQADFQVEKARPFVMPAFGSVESLTLHANALSTLTPLLQPMRFKSHSVSFVVASTPSPGAFRPFFHLRWLIRVVQSSSPGSH